MDRQLHCSNVCGTCTGHASRILFSQDSTGFEGYINPGAYGQHGYTYLPGPFLELLRERSIAETHIEQ